jgi:hypothetical protein
MPVNQANLFARPFLVKGKGNSQQLKLVDHGTMSVDFSCSSKERNNDPLFQKETGTITLFPTIESRCSKATAQLTIG